MKKLKTNRSVRYRIRPKEAILTHASRMKTEVKKKLKIFSANCSSWKTTQIHPGIFEKTDTDCFLLTVIAD